MRHTGIIACSGVENLTITKQFWGCPIAISNNLIYHKTTRNIEVSMET